MLLRHSTSEYIIVIIVVPFWFAFLSFDFAQMWKMGGSDW